MPRQPRLKSTRRDRLRELRLTPEGWVYLIVLMFVSVGAVLRNVNLLIFMAGMMYAPILLNWRLGVNRLRSLTASRFVPMRIHANDSTMIQWTCQNRHRSFPAWNVAVHDSIRHVENDEDPESNPEDSTGVSRSEESWFSRWFGEVMLRFSHKSGHGDRFNAKLGFVRINSGKSEVESYRVFFSRRGEYLVGPANVSTTFPFGLIVLRLRVPKQETLFVAPEIGRLQPTWEKRIESIATGTDAIKRRRSTQEDEFHALRPWRSGDSKKNIHWRTTARMGQPIVREHDQPNNRDFALVNDLYCPQGDQRSAELCERALSFTATAILKMGNSVEGQIAVGICGRETELCHRRSRHSIVPHLMAELAQAQASEQPDIVEAIFGVSQCVSRQTPIYVISSRNRPQILEPDFDVQQLSQSADQNTTSAKRLGRRLEQIVPLIRWIAVDSEEFEAMFRLEQDPVKREMLENLSTQWAAND